MSEPTTGTDASRCVGCGCLLLGGTHAPGCRFIAQHPLPTWSVGWRCPNCGAGNSPSTSRCACVPMPYLPITC
jgi:hypothetical protein